MIAAFTYSSPKIRAIPPISCSWKVAKVELRPQIYFKGQKLLFIEHLPFAWICERHLRLSILFSLHNCEDCIVKLIFSEVEEFVLKVTQLGRGPKTQPV